MSAEKNVYPEDRAKVDAAKLYSQTGEENRAKHELYMKEIGRVIDAVMNLVIDGGYFRRGAECPYWAQELKEFVQENEWAGRLIANNQFSAELRIVLEKFTNKTLDRDLLALAKRMAEHHLGVRGDVDEKDSMIHQGNAEYSGFRRETKYHYSDEPYEEAFDDLARALCQYVIKVLKEKNS